MADQTFQVNCGFFDAVNNDRLYTADQMNRPYKRLINNGVFATPQGTPSTDLQVVSAGNGMQITVNKGEGLFADKWFNNPSAISITVPMNTTTTPRRDSVIVQVDTRVSGRVGNIVYRTGTPSSNPLPPDIGTIADVIEYRIANIYVAASANTINNDAIVDLRGSSECPWVTSLIQQVDTSALFNQFQTAYQNQYNLYTTQYEEYTSEQKQAWEDFLSNLTSELSVATNVIMLTNSYVATTTVSNIPINIASYNSDTDILLVFINGLLAIGKYTLNSNKTSIDLTTPIASGNSVYFVVLHSVIAADIESTVSMIQTLNNKLSEFMSDSGWINFYLESGATAYNNSYTPGVRSIGGKIYLRGAFKGVTTLGSTICTLPVAYRPAMNHTWTTAAISGTSVQDTVVMQALTTGQIKLVASSGSLSSTAMIPIDTHFLSANPAVSIISDNTLDNADEEAY